MSSPVRAFAGVAVVAVLAGGGVALRNESERRGSPADGAPMLAGRVVDDQGRAVRGASIDLGGGAVAHSDEDGHFRGPFSPEPRLVTARADGHLSRTQAATSERVVEIVLPAAAATTVSVRFGGDVMFGRRYFDRNEDGRRADGHLPRAPTVAQHAGLLAHVAPLLADADLTVVNLETPLVAEPWVDPTKPRPPGFHPTKEFVFASAPQSVQALLRSGVDVVSLGNNHVLDALAHGLGTTLSALDEAGVPHFGAGRTAAEAWRPAVVERKNRRLAFLGCTTITGTEHAIPYVADDRSPGAARCTEARLRREVQAARARADTVVVMLHGGEEYEAEQTGLVRRLTRTARTAGAALVVNGHPHVVGGVTVEDGALVAETMGNLLFDQTVWPTFLSYLLRVDLRAGVPVLASVDPLMLDDYVPRPTVGALADASSRRAAGLLPGPLRLTPPGAVYAPGRPPSDERRQRRLAAGSVVRLAPGWWVDALPDGAPVTLGEDLLWTGSFEDMDTDPRTDGAHGWAFGRNVAHTRRAACSGARGMELRRSPVSAEDVVLSPAHRQLVSAGASLSVLVEVRGASPGASVDLALFGDTKGPSLSTVRLPIPTGERDAGDCRRVRLDAVVPPGVVAVQPFLRLVAPEGDLRAAHLEVDDVRLVQWAGRGATGRRYDTVDAEGDAVLGVVRDDAAAGDEPFADASVDEN